MAVETRQHAPSLIMQGRINWAAVAFFSLLAAVHLVIIFPSLFAGTYEWIISAMFFVIFSTCAVVMATCAKQMTVLPIRRVILIQWACFSRIISFDRIRSIRLTLTGTPRRPQSLMELITETGEIECPTSKYPRQQGLYLAITTGAKLTIIYGDGMSPPAAPGGRLGSLHHL